MPVISALTVAIRDIAAEEVNFEDDTSAEIDHFSEEYQKAYTQHHIRTSKGQLNHVAKKALSDDQDILEELQIRFNEWREKRPAKIAGIETVRLSNAAAKTIFVLAGVTKLRWEALGSEACEFCQELDGKVVGIEQNFLGKNEKLVAEGREGSEMEIFRPIGHAPLHEGCVCQIVADS